MYSQQLLDVLRGHLKLSNYCAIRTYRDDYGDVGPVLRQFLTRAEDLFGGLFNLTLRDKLVRGQVPE